MSFCQLLSRVISLYFYSCTFMHRPSTRIFMCTYFERSMTGPYGRTAPGILKIFLWIWTQYKEETNKHKQVCQCTISVISFSYKHKKVKHVTSSCLGSIHSFQLYFHNFKNTDTLYKQTKWHCNIFASIDDSFVQSHIVYVCVHIYM